MHPTLPRPSNSLVDGTVLFSDPRHTYIKTSPVWKLRVPSTFLRYVLIAIRKEPYYCCVDFGHTVPGCLPPISRGMRLEHWPFARAAAASGRKSCSLWIQIPAIAHFLGGFSARIFHAMKLMARRVTIMSDMKSHRDRLPHPPYYVYSLGG